MFSLLKQYKKMIEHPDTHQIFDAMSQGLQPEAMPGYLQYWETRATNAPEDERVGRIVSGLTHVALRGEMTEPERIGQHVVVSVPELLQPVRVCQRYV